MSRRPPPRCEDRTSPGTAGLRPPLAALPPCSGSTGSLLRTRRESRRFSRVTHSRLLPSPRGALTAPFSRGGMEPQGVHTPSTWPAGLRSRHGCQRREDARGACCYWAGPPQTSLRQVTTCSSRNPPGTAGRRVLNGLWKDSNLSLRRPPQVSVTPPGGLQG